MVQAEKISSSVLLDSELKKSAEEMFGELGLSLSDGINFLLKQLAERKTTIFGIESIYPEDGDFVLIQNARDRRDAGEKTYSIDDVIRKLPEYLKYQKAHKLRTLF